MISVKVPATSANMGPGFDSLGIAFGLYNRIHFRETDDGLCFLRKGDVKPSDNPHNLIYRAMKLVFDECGYKEKGIWFSQDSDIPMTRGLGSSSACIIGGMLAANIMAGRPFNYDNILDLATKLEGHPDNVTPALYGGFCTSVYEDGHVSYTSNKLLSNLKFAVMIPDYPVATRKSRTVVPDSFSKEDTVYNISHTALLVSALITGKTSLLKSACRDKIHQSYRREYIDGMDDMFEKAYELGASAVYLSGSGPTVTAVIDGGILDFSKKMNAYFWSKEMRWKCRVLTIDNVGAVVTVPIDKK